MDGGNTWWHPRADGSDTQSMLVKEFVPFLGRRGYDLGRIGLFGLSMGGFGSLLLASQGRLPGVRAVAAMSPAVWDSYDPRMDSAFDGPADFAAHDVFALRPRLAALPKRIDCGTGDDLAATVRDYRAGLPGAVEGGFQPGGHDDELLALRPARRVVLPGPQPGLNPRHRERTAKIVTVLILLPPSEGKTPATAGDAVDWASLSFPELNTYRAKVLEGLGTVSAHEDALALLGVGASLRADVERNTRLHAEPAAPAHQVYSGVLYDALGYDSLTAAQRRKADESVLVISALWGAIRFGDSVPAYRLSMGTALPDVGRLASFWKPQLTAALAGGRGR